jgi:putative PIG3 family NAD(P)H quinone oxidoreductase
MRAITCKQAGEPDVLTIVDIPKPTPASTQLLIHVKAAALNRADILQRRGQYAPPPGESEILGLEIAGEVVQVGTAVTHFKLGDRVFGLVGSGGYADYCVIDAQTACFIPEKFSYLEAAAIPEAFLTANEALFTLGNLQPGETVLIHAGGSGVGTAAIQLAKYIGATVYTTIGRNEKINAVKSLGADHVINYKSTDFAAEIQNVDVIIDFIGASYLAKHLAMLKPSGRLICVGMLGGTRAEINLNVILTKRLQIKGLIMRARTLEDKRAMTYNFNQRWLPLLSTGQLHPIVDSVFAFEEAQKAHAYMESNANIGKIILQVN